MNEKAYRQELVGKEFSGIKFPIGKNALPILKHFEIETTDGIYLGVLTRSSDYIERIVLPQGLDIYKNLHIDHIRLNYHGVKGKNSENLSHLYNIKIVLFLKDDGTDYEYMHNHFFGTIEIGFISGHPDEHAIDHLINWSKREPLIYPVIPYEDRDDRLYYFNSF